MKKTLLAVLIVGLGVLGAGCNTTPAGDGAVLGGALGAGLGAIIGHQSGHQGEGALIGAGVGALTGALAGDAVGDRRDAAARRASPEPVPSAARPVVHGQYVTRVVRSPSGETYEERLWVPDR